MARKSNKKVSKYQQLISLELALKLWFAGFSLFLILWAVVKFAPDMFENVPRTIRIGAFYLTNLLIILPTVYIFLEGRRRLMNGKKLNQQQSNLVIFALGGVAASTIALFSSFFEAAAFGMGLSCVLYSRKNEVQDMKDFKLYRTMGYMVTAIAIIRFVTIAIYVRVSG